MKLFKGTVDTDEMKLEKEPWMQCLSLGESFFTFMDLETAQESASADDAVSSKAGWGRRMSMYRNVKSDVNNNGTINKPFLVK